jgi:hypothetical protein
MKLIAAAVICLALVFVPPARAKDGLLFDRHTARAAILVLSRRTIPDLRHPARKLIVALPLLAACAACGDGRSATSGAQAAACRGADLAGRFAVVRGSAGAGNISYRLVLRNRSAGTCSLNGLPVVSLRSRAGNALPTHVRTAYPGRLAILVTLRPGQRADATARFSPDVPGPGEQTPGRCEPTAYRLVVTAPGGGATSAAIQPPTSVCEHGLLQFSTYVR